MVLAGRSRWVFGVLAALLAVVGTVLLPARQGWGGRLARSGYDSLYRLSPGVQGVPTNCPVVLVYLDLASHLELHQDPAKRWDRALHTRLVRKLTEAGARVIAFDILFDRPWSDSAVDREFAEAMRRHGRVILSAERHRSGQVTGNLPGLKVDAVQGPVHPLLEASAGWGIAELRVDDDWVVRRALREISNLQEPTLSAAVVRAAGMELSSEPTGGAEEWLRYYGPPLTLPWVSYRSVLQEGGVDAGLFRDKVVLVGARPMVGLFQERRDELRTPLSDWEDGDVFMPGVEVHATQILNWMRGDGLRRSSPTWERAVGLVVAFVLAAGLAGLRTVGGAIVAAGLAIAAPLLAAGLWGWQGIWFPWIGISAVMVPIAWTPSMVVRGVAWARQRRRLEALRQVDRRRIEWQAALLDRATEVILVCDLEGRVTYANPSARRLIPQPSAETDRPLGDCISDLASRLAGLRESGEWSGTIEWRSESAARRILETRWNLIRDGGGRPEGVLVIGTDVTEQRRMEFEFLRAQKWEAVGSLAGGMAHDLNSVLAPALLGLQVLQREISDSGTLRTLAMVESRTRRGSETVQQVLRFLRGDPLPEAEIDVGALVRDLERLVQQSFPRTVRVNALIAPKVGVVRGGAANLQQALLNLCLNARDAMPDGGELLLAVDDADLSVEEAAALPQARPGAFVLIAVSDTGVGIPAENLPRIFEDLFTTKPTGEGTGLGLSSVQRIVRQHGGFVAVSSEVGVGSTFEVYLPRVGR